MTGHQLYSWNALMETAPAKERTHQHSLASSGRRIIVAQLHSWRRVVHDGGGGVKAGAVASDQVLFSVSLTDEALLHVSMNAICYFS